MTPPFGLMMFWLPEMRMRPLWVPQTMLAVSVRVTVTLTALNSVGCIRVKVLVCQQGPIGAEIGTLGPRVFLF